MTRVVIRATALDDLRDAAIWFRDNAGPAITDRFSAAVRRSIDLAAAMPGTGSPRWAVETGHASLRSRRVHEFP